MKNLPAIVLAILIVGVISQQPIALEKASVANLRTLNPEEVVEKKDAIQEETLSIDVLKETVPETPVSEQEQKKEDPAEKTVKDVAETAALATAATGAAVAAGSAGLTAAGFTSSGVALGSLAASAQTATVASGTGFAILQSLGASGIIASVGLVALAIAAVAGVIYAGITFFW